MKNIGRNQPCPCGSGKKYKKCCALKSPLQRRQFTNISSGKGQSTLSKLSGLVSKKLSSKTPSTPSNSNAELLKNRVNQKKTNEKDTSSNNVEQEKPKE